MADRTLLLPSVSFTVKDCLLWWKRRSKEAAERTKMLIKYMFYLCQPLCLYLGRLTYRIIKRRKWFIILSRREEARNSSKRLWHLNLKNATEKSTRGRGKNVSKCREVWMWPVQAATAGSQGPWQRVPDAAQVGSDHEERWRTCWRLRASPWKHGAASTDF